MVKTDFEKFFLIGMLMAFFVIFILAPFAIKLDGERRDKCKSMGGYDFKGLCIKQDSVIDTRTKK
jgi:predicted RND superfamily exporter protein